MTSLQPSGFDRLSRPVREWIWKQKWQALRDVQEKAIPVILAGGDVVISARTAAGKTEAVFLPLLTRIAASDTPADGFAVLCISPLKALINDQFRRLESLCETCGVIVTKWHGDVAANIKARARQRPSGIVLITPESLEALLVRRGGEIARMFSRLDAVVIDELHAFIGTERGMQMQSILSRIEVVAGRDSIDRIGLSATLGDMRLAAEALRPGSGDTVKIIEGNDAGNGVRLQVRGYLLERPTAPPEDEEADDERQGGGRSGNVPKEEEYSRSRLPKAMADDLFRLTRGKRNLLFAGSRTNVEIAADRLRSMCDDERLPQEYFAHHGSLSKAIREDVETRLRDDPRPTTAVATTTLELGIDIGDVDAIAQIGPGSSVASLRQRLGRSGRRAGRPQTLRMFVAEPQFERGGHPCDRLRLDLVQAVAMVECLIEGWCEPPQKAGLHLSTLIHQVLALIVQYGGVLPGQAFKLLCERGPFRNVDKGLFAELLAAIGPNGGKLIEQSGNGLLMIGAAGEEITESHDFYPVFATDVEYRILHEARTLGTYPLTSPLAAGETIIFSGRRWIIVQIDDRARVIMVKPTRTGKPPYFSGRGGDVHDHIVATMRRVLSSSDSYTYLDGEAVRQLGEAREAYGELELGQCQVIAFGRGVLLFPWVGTRKLETLAVALLMKQFKVSSFHHVIAVDDCTVDGIEAALQEIAGGPAPRGMDLARQVAQPAVAKFDGFLSPDLMCRVTAVERLESESLPAIAEAMLVD